jgi:hypothetical protein
MILSFTNRAGHSACHSVILIHILDFRTDGLIIHPGMGTTDLAIHPIIPGIIPVIITGIIPGTVTITDTDTPIITDTEVIMAMAGITTVTALFITGQDVPLKPTGMPHQEALLQPAAGE